MSQVNIADIAGKILKLIEPLESEQRARVIQAALVMVGDGPLPPAPGSTNGATKGSANHDDGSSLPVKVRTWMSQNQVTKEQLDQVFHIDGETVDVIAATIPGKNAKLQSLNAYVLTGLARMLVTGDPTFDDNSARAVCQSGGFHDATNHARILKDKGSDFTGTKDKGWTVTSPGLKKAAALVKEIAQP